MKQDKNLLPYFPSGNIISVPVNQRVCKNCNNFKQNSHSNYKQEIVPPPTEKFISPKTDSKKLYHEVKKKKFVKILRNSQEKKPIRNT